MTRTLATLTLALLAVTSACGGDDAIDLLSGAGGAAGAAGGAAGGCVTGCAGEEPYCDATGGRCVECLDPSHCDVGQVCDSATGECSESCSVSQPCTSGDRPFCDPLRSVCVQCQSEVSCNLERPRCSNAGICVECLTSTDCVDPAQPVCNEAENECQEL